MESVKLMYLPDSAASSPSQDLLLKDNLMTADFILWDGGPGLCGGRVLSFKLTVGTNRGRQDVIAFGVFSWAFASVSCLCSFRPLKLP